MAHSAGEGKQGTRWGSPGSPFLPSSLHWTQFLCRPIGLSFLADSPPVIQLPLLAPSSPLPCSMGPDRCPLQAFFFFLTETFLKIFVNFLATVGLCCCAQAFSSCSEQGLFCGCGVQASHCDSFSCGARALGCFGLVVARLKLSSCGARA